MDGAPWEALEARIRDARDRQAAAGKLRTDLARIAGEERGWRDRVRVLEAEHAREARDVLEFEERGLLEVLSRLLGAPAGSIEKEKREELEARLRLDAAAATQAALAETRSGLEAGLHALGDPAGDLRRALVEKEEVLAGGGGEAAAALLDLAGEDGRLAFLEKEYREALVAGRLAVRELAAADEALGKAAGWGPLDVVGGGVLSSALKHPHVARARRAVGRAMEALRRFRREVEDLEGEGIPPVPLDTGGRATFVEWFLDGLVEDLVAQSAVRRARERVGAARGAVEGTLRILGPRSGDVADRRAALHRRREEILLR